MTFSHFKEFKKKENKRLLHIANDYFSDPGSSYIIYIEGGIEKYSTWQHYVWGLKLKEDKVQRIFFKMFMKTYDAWEFYFFFIYTESKHIRFSQTLT